MRIQKGSYFLEWEGDSEEPFSLYTQSYKKGRGVKKTFIHNSSRKGAKEIIDLINAYLLLTSKKE